MINKEKETKEEQEKDMVNTNTKEEREMENGKMSSLVIKYSIPTIIGMLVNAIYVLVDRFWVGRLPGEEGTLGLVAIGISLPIVTIIMAFSQLIGIGLSANISMALGRKDKETAEDLLHNSIIITIFSAIIITVVGIIFAERLLVFLGASEVVMSYALPYTRISLMSTIFYMLAFTLSNSVRATGGIKIFAIASIIAAVIKIILDPIFILSLNIGISGAAYVSIISQVIITIYLCSIYYKKKTVLKIQKSKFKFNFTLSKSIIIMGMGPFIMAIASALVVAVANTQIMKYGALQYGSGEIVVGAFTIISSILMLFFMVVMGIAYGVQPIISYNYANKNFKRYKEAYKWAVAYSVGLCLVGLIFVLLFPRQMASLFNDDPLLIDVAVGGMRIFLLGLPLLSMQIVSANMFQAIGKAKMSIFLSALRQALLLTPLYVILPSIFGMRGIWFVAPTADILAFSITLFFVYKEFKLDHATI